MQKLNWITTLWVFTLVSSCSIPLKKIETLPPPPSINTYSIDSNIPQSDEKNRGTFLQAHPKSHFVENSKLCRKPRFPTPKELSSLKAYFPIQKGRRVEISNLDLNGDSRRDLLVGHSYFCTRGTNCAHSIYILTKKCAHYVGSIWSSEIFVEKTSHGGLGDLRVQTSRMADLFEKIYIYDGKSYVPTRQRECRRLTSENVNEPCIWTNWKKST